MDLSETISPNSDQQQFDDYLGGITRTVTITAVTRGSAEQPVNLELAEFPGKPYKPNKSNRRLLVLAWGADSSVYVGRRLTLFGDPTVAFGGSVVGGIKISHMSDIDKPLTVALTVTRGKKKAYTVQPLPPTRDWQQEITLAGTDLSALEALGKAAKQAGSGDDVVGQIRAAYMNAKGGDA